MSPYNASDDERKLSSIFKLVLSPKILELTEKRDNLKKTNVLPTFPDAGEKNKRFPLHPTQGYYYSLRALVSTFSRTPNPHFSKTSWRKFLCFS
jgi:hypothetical protein